MLKISYPYCGGQTEYVYAYEIDPGVHGEMAYVCRPCNTCVEVHQETDTPLGSPANAELRKWRKAAHDAFDQIWKARYRRKSLFRSEYTQAMARDDCYDKLAERMGIPPDECRISMFDETQCDEVIELCARRRLG